MKMLEKHEMKRNKMNSHSQDESLFEDSAYVGEEDEGEEMH